MEKNKVNIFIYLILFVLTTTYFGCVSSPTSPVAGIGGNSGTITIFSPVTNDSVGYDGALINYTVNPIASNQSVELYVNGQFQSTYFTNISSSKALKLAFDSTMMGTKISYYLKYYDSNGTAAFSDTMNNILITEPRIIPTKPFNIRLTVFQGSTNNNINIAWQNNFNGDVFYEIWRRDGFSGDYHKQIGPLPAGSFNVNEYNLMPNVVYYYKIRGKNKFGFSEFSDPVNTAGAGGSGSFPPPTELQAVAVSSTVVQLTWKDNSNNENLFIVERNDNWSVWSKYEVKGTVANNVISFTDDTGGITGGHTYLYRVKSYSNSDSSWSNIASVKTPLF